MRTCKILTFRIIKENIFIQDVKASIAFSILFVLVSSVLASATEIAQAAIHRCLKEQVAYELSVFARNLDNPPGRDRTDQAVSNFNEVLTRMVISDVIEARMMK